MSSILLMNSIALMYGGVLNCSAHLMEVHLYKCGVGSTPMRARQASLEHL